MNKLDKPRVVPVPAKDSLTIQKEFRARQWKRMGAYLPLVFTFAVVVSTHDAYSRGWIWCLGTGAVLSVIGLVYSLFVWRCPGCNASFGKRKLFGSCPHCRVKLED